VNASRVVKAVELRKADPHLFRLCLGCLSIAQHQRRSLVGPFFLVSWVWRLDVEAFVKFLEACVN